MKRALSHTWLKRPTRRSRLFAELLEARDVPATALFQQGTNGYAGAFEVRIGSDIATNQLGSASQNYFMDGPGTGSPDQLDLLRFDNIIGSGPGQIPLGSVINSATLVYSTSTVGNAQTAGPYGAARMLVPFDATTTYTSVPGGSPSQANGTFTRVDSAFVSGATIAIPAGGTATARVTEHVQAWASGATNEGFVVRAGAGNTDGWSINTIGNNTVANRPLLSVDYSPPDLPLSTARFQQGVNGFADTVDVWLQSSNTTSIGATLDQQFLDGGTPDDQMLIRFNNLFGAGAGQVPANATIRKAFLVITTGVAGNAQSNGPYSANRMLVDWNTSSTYIDSFGGDGPTEAQNEITPAVDNLIGFTPDGRNLFDITSVVDGWRTGAFPNFGVDIRANGTTDGWMVKFTGAPEADARPELVILYEPPPPPPPAVTALDIVSGALTVTAGTGSPNNAVTLSLAGGNYTIADTGATITLSPAAIAAGWSGSGTNTVTGPDSSVTSLIIDLNEGNDSFTLQGINDTLTVRGGGQAADVATFPTAITYTGTVRITGFGTITQPAASPLAISDLTLGAGGIGTAASNIRTTATTLALLGGAGGVFLTETDGASVSFQAAGAGEVHITNLAGDLAIGDTSFGGTGPIVITSDDGVAVNAPLGNSNTSGTIAITANTDGAGAEGFSQGSLGSIQTTNTGNGQGGNPTAFSLTVNTAGGGTGNIAFGSNVSTGTGGLIAVNARTGNITMTAGTLRSGAGATGRITLNGVGIGASANRIRTSAGDIRSTAGNGGVFVEEVSDAPGAMQATATGAGNIFLFASSATNNGLIINGPVSTQSGSITLRADDDLIIQAPVGGPGFSGTVLCEASLDAVNEQVFRIDQDVGLGFNGSIFTENATANAVRITVSPTSVAAGVGGAILGNITVGNGGTIAVNAAVGTAAARAGRILQVPGTALNAGANGIVNLVARDNSIGTVTDPIRVTAGTITAATNSVATSPAPLQLPGDIFIVATGPASFAATTTTAAPNVGTITLTTEAGALTINGPTRTDDGSITLNGAAGLVLNGAIGGTGETGTLTLNPVTGGTTQPGGSIITAGGVLVTGGAASLTQAANDLTTIAANLTGALSLADANAVATGTVGTTTGITATSTTVTGGRLNVLTGANVTGPVTAAANGTVGGTGTIAGSLTANAQGAVSPGTSPGRLTVNGNTTFNANSTYAAELNGTTAGTSYDQLTVNGTVNLGGATLALTVGFTPTIGNTFIIVDNDGGDAVTGTFAGLAEGATVSAGGQAFTISYVGGSGNDVVLTHTGAAAPRIASTVVNGGAAQRSRVTELTVTFSAQVTFATTAGAAFTLTRVSDGAVVTFTATPNVVGGVTVVTINGFGGSATQSGSLADGRYTLTALANQITAGGVQLDGNGDGTPGDNYVFGESQGLFRFFGDINGDRHVDIADFSLFSSTFNLSTGQTGFNAAFDFNGDGHIDIADFGQFSIRLFTPLP